MRKIGLAIALLLPLWTISCRSGDESPQEISPLLALLQVNTLEDTTYNGTARESACNEDPLFSRCPLLQEAENTMFSSLQYNLYVVLFLQNGAITGNIHLITPHFDSAPHDYRFDVTGTTDYAPDHSRTIELKPISNLPTPDSSKLFVDFSRFSVSETPDAMTGTMTLVLRDTEEGSSVSVDYTIDLRKVQ